MRNIGKARLKSFHKKVKQIVHEYGGIPNKNNPTQSQYQFEMETKAGPLGITLHEDSDLDGTSVFSIFGRLWDVKRANEVLGKSDRLNPHSGKWNFHYTNENDCLYIFEENLDSIVTDKPITDYAALELQMNTDWDAPNKLVVYDEIHEGRLCIDPISSWSNVHGKTGLVVLCDGASVNIRKSTPFQLWIKGIKI